MLSVASSTPQNHQEDVYRDIKIELNFSHTVHDSSLVSDYFKVYRMPGWNGYVPISITKNGNKVILTPEQDLEANHDYAIWIMGDKDVNDQNYEGVVSVVGDVMDGHHIIYFKTGEQREVDIDTQVDVGGYDPAPGSDLPFTTSEEQAQIYASNKVLDVTKTIPSDESCEVSGLTSIQVFFDQSVSVNGPVSGIVSIEAAPLIFGEEPPVPELMSIDAVGWEVDIETDGNISGNTEYTVTIGRDHIIGHTGEQLNTDYQFSFTTELDPLYTSPYLVRQRGGFLIPNELSDCAILRYIHEASMWFIDEVLEMDEYPTGSVPKIVTKIVTCKTIWDISNAITEGTLRGIREKRLADLRIVYNTDGLDAALRRIEECIENGLAKIGKGKTQIGIKSLHASKRAYVGSKRTIHRYSKRDLRWPRI